MIAAFNPTLGNEFNKSLLEPMLNPRENINARIDAKVTFSKSIFFLPLSKYPTAIPTTNGNTNSKDERFAMKTTSN
jgi:hypothetical protein